LHYTNFLVIIIIINLRYGCCCWQVQERTSWQTCGGLWRWRQTGQFSVDYLIYDFVLIHLVSEKRTPQSGW